MADPSTLSLGLIALMHRASTAPFNEPSFTFVFVNPKHDGFTILVQLITLSFNSVQLFSSPLCTTCSLVYSSMSVSVHAFSCGCAGCGRQNHIMLSQLAFDVGGVEMTAADASQIMI